MSSATGRYLAPALILLSALCAPAAAQKEEVAVREVQVRDVAFDMDRMMRDPAYAQQVLAGLDNFSPDADPATLLNVDEQRLYALTALRRTDEIRATFDRMIARRPAEARFYFALWNAAIAAEDAERVIVAIEQAGRNVPAAQRSQLRRLLPREMISPLLVHLLSAGDRAARARLAEALLTIEWPNPLEPEALDELRLIVMDQRFGQGDRAAAAAFAAALSTPSNVAALIVQRRYDGLLADGVDRLALLGASIAAQDRATARALAAAPRDIDRVLDRIRLLRSLGRNEEALALAAPFSADAPATAMRGEQGMWLINEAVHALLALGRDDEAVLLMNRLVALPVRALPFLISATINHGEVLREAGDHAEALAHARMVERDLSRFASDYGKMWNSATIACALASLGRAGEAATMVAGMQAGRDGNPAALLRAYLCLDDGAAAEALLISRIEGDDPQSMLLALQDYTLAGTRRDPIVDRLLALRRRPAVRAALDRVGRVLPLPVARTYWGAL